MEVTWLDRVPIQSYTNLKLYLNDYLEVQKLQTKSLVNRARLNFQGSRWATKSQEWPERLDKQVSQVTAVSTEKFGGK